MTDAPIAAPLLAWRGAAAAGAAGGRWPALQAALAAEQALAAKQVRVFVGRTTVQAYSVLGTQDINGQIIEVTGKAPNASADVIVDPAGPALKSNPDDARGASRAIYDEYNITKTDVIPNLTEGHAVITAYDKGWVIHIIGPRFADGTTDAEAIKQLRACYLSVLRAYIAIPDRPPHLRLLPISSGLFCTTDLKQDMPDITAKAYFQALKSLKASERDKLLICQISMCIYFKSLFDDYRKAFEAIN